MVNSASMQKAECRRCLFIAGCFFVKQVQTNMIHDDGEFILGFRCGTQKEKEKTSI